MEEKLDTRFKIKGKVSMVKGSILTPHNSGLRFVLSINNTKGDPLGNPLLSTFDKKWRKVREESRGWYANKTGEYKLGAINTTAVQSDVWVIHTLCQNDDHSIDLTGLTACLKKICASAKYEKASVHIDSKLTAMIPELETLTNEYLVNEGVNVSFYKD